MDFQEINDTNVELERSENNTPIQTPVESIPTDPVLESVPLLPSNGDSSVLEMETVPDENKPQSIVPSNEAKSAEAVAGVEEVSDQEQTPVLISVSSEQSDTANLDSVLDVDPSVDPENKDSVEVVSFKEGSISPASPTRSSLSSKGSRSKQRKRVSFNEKREDEVPCSTIWPRSDEFTVEAGEEGVKKYVRECWSLEESWLHCVDYLGEEPASSGRHRYRVKFSQPTRRRPIPAHAASVYFTLAAGCKGEDRVEVWWVLEGQRLVHRPGEGQFIEQWLKDVLEAKAIICAETLF